MSDVIPIKPHHFVDILSAYGGGKTEFSPHPYGHALHAVAAALLRNPAARLRIVLGADAICAPCTHNIGGRCDDTIDISFRPAAPASKQEYNLLLDRRWCERLGLEEGDELTARELCVRMQPLAADGADVYRELPAEMSAQRMQRLAEGIARYLETS